MGDGMVFVTLGSQKFQFNRLLVKIDELIENGEILDDVIAQIGYSDYIPKNFKYKIFFNHDEFMELVQNSSYVITHGGTGTIMEAIKYKKKVIAVQRMAEYKEHVDNHQKQILIQFDKMKLISPCYDVDQLHINVRSINMFTMSNYVSEKFDLTEDIKKYLTSIPSNI